MQDNNTIRKLERVSDRTATKSARLKKILLPFAIMAGTLAVPAVIIGLLTSSAYIGTSFFTLQALTAVLFGDKLFIYAVRGTKLNINTHSAVLLKQSFRKINPRKCNESEIKLYEFDSELPECYSVGKSTVIMSRAVSNCSDYQKAALFTHCAQSNKNGLSHIFSSLAVINITGAGIAFFGKVLAYATAVMIVLIVGIAAMLIKAFASLATASATILLGRTSIFQGNGGCALSGMLSLFAAKGFIETVKFIADIIQKGIYWIITKTLGFTVKSCSQLVFDADSAAANAGYEHDLKHLLSEEFPQFTTGCRLLDSIHENYPSSRERTSRIQSRIPRLRRL